MTADKPPLQNTGIDRVEDLEISHELGEIRSVKLSDLPSWQPTVSPAQEAEALEPIYFGSAVRNYDDEVDDEDLPETAVSKKAQPKKSQPEKKAKIADEDSQEADTTPENIIEAQTVPFTAHPQSTVIIDEEMLALRAGKLSEEAVDPEPATTVISTPKKASEAKREPEAKPERIHLSATRRGGYNPTLDAQISAAKYRMRQRNVIILAIIAIAGVAGSLWVESTHAAVALSVAALVPLIAYLAGLRHTVRQEEAIRYRRHQRYVRLQEEKTEKIQQRQQRIQGLTVLEIDDEDPIFDHLGYVSVADMPAFSDLRVAKHDEKHVDRYHAVAG